jgi:hypothetical protein
MSKYGQNLSKSSPIWRILWDFYGFLTCCGRVAASPAATWKQPDHGHRGAHGAQARGARGAHETDLRNRIQLGWDRYQHVLNTKMRPKWYQNHNISRYQDFKISRYQDDGYSELYDWVTIEFRDSRTVAVEVFTLSLRWWSDLCFTQMLHTHQQFNPLNIWIYLNIVEYPFETVEVMVDCKTTRTPQLRRLELQRDFGGWAIIFVGTGSGILSDLSGIEKTRHEEAGCKFSLLNTFC